MNFSIKFPGSARSSGQHTKLMIIPTISYMINSLQKMVLETRDGAIVSSGKALII